MGVLVNFPMEEEYLKNKILSELDGLPEEAVFAIRKKIDDIGRIYFLKKEKIQLKLEIELSLTCEQQKKIQEAIEQQLFPVIQERFELLINEILALTVKLALHEGGAL